jgi:hypothetical protein
MMAFAAMEPERLAFLSELYTRSAGDARQGVPYEALINALGSGSWRTFSRRVQTRHATHPRRLHWCKGEVLVNQGDEWLVPIFLDTFAPGHLCHLPVTRPGAAAGHE